ncbi:MAG: hypothetical protein WAL98_02975, partial [Desulfatiglandaceae bacterium]
TCPCKNKMAVPLDAFYTFEPVSKRSILFEVKSKIPDFERGKAKILTTGICWIFRGLKLSSAAEIGQKGAF